MKDLFGVVLLIVFVCGVVCLAAYSLWARRHYRNANDWPGAEATIQSGKIEQFDKYTAIPCFAFSYVVAGEYYSGRFFLDVPRDDADSKIREMIDQKLEVHYNPQNAGDWFIPVKLMDGYNVR